MRTKKLDYQAIYEDIVKAQSNKEKFKKSVITEKRKHYPRTYREIAAKWNISINQVSLINKSMKQNGTEANK